MPYADPEKNKECIKKYYEDHKEELTEKNKKYQEENREKILEQRKKYREENKEKIIEQRQKFYQENKDKVKEKSKEYYEENKEGKIKEYQEANKEIRQKYNKVYFKEYRENNLKCKGCNLFIVQKINNYLCSYCNPDKKTKRLKTKELKVKTLLEEQDYKFTYNKKCNIDKSCQTYFPDFLIDCNSFFIVIECDEFAHSGYDTQCERIRENNICFALGLPCVFLRFNPDKTKVKMKTKQKVLKSYIEYYKNKTICDNETIYLFY